MVKVYRVQVDREVLVPPLSIALTTLTTGEKPDTDIIYSPQSGIPGLLIAHSVCNKDEPMVLVRNTRNHDITITKNKYFNLVLQ